MTRLLTVLTVAVLALAGCSSGSSGSTGTPAAAAKADSGAAGCDAVAKIPGGTKVSAATHTAVRAQFAGSPSADLRTAGVAYVDEVYQVDSASVPDLSQVPVIIQDYAKLATACAAHGHSLPAISG
jgi:hypothetical protein